MNAGDDFGGLPPFSYFIGERPDPTWPARGGRALHLPCGRVFHGTPDLATAIQVASDRTTYICAAGLMLDPASATMDLPQIAANLLTALAAGTGHFWDALDALAGRWVVVFRGPGMPDPWIAGDATGMLKINYRTDGSMCSSNIFLLSQALRFASPPYRPSYSLLRSLWKFGTLGNLTPLENVRILTPNHALNLGTGALFRFFPRSRISPALSLDDVAEEIVRLCDLQLSLLEKRFSLFPSLTGGIDSRLSLALSIKARGATYFTYVLQNIHHSDAIIAARLAHELHLKHYCLLDDRHAVDLAPCGFGTHPIGIAHHPGLQQKVNAWDWYQHSHGAIDSHQTLVSKTLRPGDLPPLHIRANLYEIGRCFWGKSYGTCTSKSEILYKSRRDWAALADPIFEAFFEETQLADATRYGYDLLDMFYWEHRCGTWVSEILQGSDFIFNTHSLVNCRRILVLLLSIPFEQRTTARLFRHIIDRRLPAARSVPINSSG